MRNINSIIKSDGMAQTPTAGIYTLAAGTYYAELESSQDRGVEKASISSTHWIWNAALAATLTVEASNFRDATPHGSTLWDTTSVPAVTADGISAGSVVQDLVNIGAGRVRWKIVVTTQGTLQGSENRKVMS